MDDAETVTRKLELLERMDSMSFDGRKVPEHTRGSIARYIVDHVEPGDFLEAVMCNDLRESIARADDMNRANLNAIVFFMYNEAPASCWGSKAAYNDWVR